MSSIQIVPSPIDLTALNNVKSWLEIALDNHTEDSDIQDVITGFSQYVLDRTGITSFNQVAQYTEQRDGSGNSRLFTRNRPIRSVVSLVVNGVAIAASPAWPTFGYYISDDLKSIVLRGSSYPITFGYTSRLRNVAVTFVRGTGNIAVTYTAGYQRVPFDLELAVRKAAAINYKRKSTIDLASKAVSAGGTTGTTRFRDWEVPPEVASVIDFYSRQAVV